MKQMRKSLTALLLMTVLLTASLPMVVFAANHYTYSASVGSTWVRVAYSDSGDSSGLDKTLYISNQYPAGTYSLDILMTGKNGNTIWSQENSVLPWATGTYYCGSNVYNVYVKYHSSGQYGTVITTHN